MCNLLKCSNLGTKKKVEYQHKYNKNYQIKYINGERNPDSV